ncbi:MAG: hypothetical protein ACYS8W_10685 [Planctomycetota bacterium]
MLGNFAHQVIRNLERATSGGVRYRNGISRKKKSLLEKRVPVLIRMLGSEIEEWSTDAHRELVRITFQDFGYDTAAWKKWHERNAHLSRSQWAETALEQESVFVRGLERGGLLRKLIGALGHPIMEIRAAAYHLLIHHTGRSIFFPIRADKKTRERHVRKWINWLESEAHCA